MSVHLFLIGCVKYFEWYLSSFSAFTDQLDLFVSKGEGKIYSGYVVFIQLMFEYPIRAMDCVLTLKGSQSSEGGKVWENGKI